MYMGLCNVYGYSISKTVKLSDSYKVLIKLRNDEYVNDYAKIGITAPSNGEYMELFECVNVEFPFYKFTEETVSWGNNKEAVYIPDYDSIDDLKLTLLEHYSSNETYKNKDEKNTYNNALKIGQLVDLFLNKLFDMKTFTYKLDDFIPELRVIIASNDFRYYVAEYKFTNLKLSDYSSYDLDYSSSSPTKWELSFAFEGYSIIYYTNYEDPFEKPEKQTKAVKQNKPNDKTPTAPLVEEGGKKIENPDKSNTPATDVPNSNKEKRQSKLKAPDFGVTPLPDELKAAADTANSALDGIEIVPNNTFGELGGDKVADPRSSMESLDNFDTTADNSIDPIAAPTPEKIDGELKGEAVNDETLMNDMEAKAAANHYAGIAAAAEADEGVKAIADAQAREWLESSNTNVLGDIDSLPDLLELEDLDEDLPAVATADIELAPSFGINAPISPATEEKDVRQGKPDLGDIDVSDITVNKDELSIGSVNVAGGKIETKPIQAMLDLSPSVPETTESNTGHTIASMDNSFLLDDDLAGIKPDDALSPTEFESDADTETESKTITGTVNDIKLQYSSRSPELGSSDGHTINETRAASSASTFANLQAQLTELKGDIDATVQDANPMDVSTVSISKPTVKDNFGIDIANDSTGKESDYEYTKLDINKSSDAKKTKTLFEKVKSGEAKFVVERYLGQEGYLENGGIATELYFELQEGGVNKRYMVASGLERSDAFLADPDGESKWYVNKTEDKQRLAGSSDHAFHQNFDPNAKNGITNTKMNADAYYYDYQTGKIVKDSKTSAGGVNTHGTQFANQGKGCLLIDAPTVENIVTTNSEDGQSGKNKKGSITTGGWSSAAIANADSTDVTVGRKAARSYSNGQNYSQKLAGIAYTVFGTKYTASGAGSFNVENRYNAGSTANINSLSGKKKQS